MAIGESSSMAAERREISASSAFEAKNFPVGMRVVAVDDDQICLAMLKKLLSKCEYKGLISSFLLFPFFFQFQVEVSFFFISSGVLSDSNSKNGLIFCVVFSVKIATLSRRLGECKSSFFCFKKKRLIAQYFYSRNAPKGFIRILIMHGVE
jgi:hypothetical protein